MTTHVAQRVIPNDPISLRGPFQCIQSAAEYAGQIFAEANKNTVALRPGQVAAAVTVKQTLPHSSESLAAIKPQESPIKVDASQITYFGHTKRTGDGKCAMPSPSSASSGIAAAHPSKLHHTRRGAEHFSFARIMRNGAFFMALDSFHHICSLPT